MHRQTCGCGTGEIHDHQRSTFGSAGDGEAAAVQAHQVVDDAQSQSGAADRPGRATLDLPEAIEDRRPLLEWYARTAVGNLDSDPIAGAGRDRTSHCAAGPGELEGIGQQIHQYLLQVLRIERGRDRLARVHGEFDVTVDGK